MAGGGQTHPSAVSGVFGEPFAEQVAFFRRKLARLIPTRRWDDLLGAAHDEAFMVAGAMEADLLTDLAAAVDKAISQGRGIEEFRRDFRDIVARNGWTGWTGEGSVKGEAWRVRTIYRTNMYTSYAAGRLAQLRAANFKYWIYFHGGSLEPRVEHLSWNGLALDPDHPFWQTHYPPSDWGCSCYVVGTNSEAGIRRLGGDPAKRLPKDWQARDPKTGAPVGIGRGWDYAPGGTASDAVIALVGKISNWDYRVAKAFMDEVPEAQRDALALAYRALPSTAEDAERIARLSLDPQVGRQPRSEVTLGPLTARQAAAIEGGAAQGFDFSITRDAVVHVHAKHGDQKTEVARGQRAVTPADYAMLPRLLDGAIPSYAGISDGFRRPSYETVLPIGGEEIVAIWGYWPKRRTMGLQTMYVRKRKR